jgi:hypothetical protein
MYPESNTLPKQPHPRTHLRGGGSAAGLVDSVQKTKLFEDELSNSFSEQFDIDNGELVIYPPDDLLGGDTVYEIYGKGFHDSIDEKVLKHLNKPACLLNPSNSRGLKPGL